VPQDLIVILSSFPETAAVDSSEISRRNISELVTATARFFDTRNFG